MKRILRHFLSFIAVAALLFGLLEWRSDGFSPSAICIPLLGSRDPSQEPLTFEWPREFSYLGRGKQAFAFESTDGNYVVKFFDRHRMELPWYHIFATQKWINRRKSKQKLYPESYRLAYAKMREETDLLHVHMGPSSEIFPTITIKDKASRRFQIDLNQVPFILQKKASIAFLDQLSHSKHNKEELRSWLDQYISINLKRISLSIANKDKHIKDNYRCEKKRLVYIDPGRYYVEQELLNPEFLKSEWNKATYELRAWIAQNVPSELVYFDDLADSGFKETETLLSKLLRNEPRP
jgi:hypothetical protein